MKERLWLRLQVEPSVGTPCWHMSLCLSWLSLRPTVCSARSKMPLHYVSLVASILVSMETHFTNTSSEPNDPVLWLSSSLLCVQSVSFWRLNVGRKTVSPLVFITQTFNELLWGIPKQRVTFLCLWGTWGSSWDRTWVQDPESRIRP